ncbi:MAG: AMP-binding protein [Clostridia bacterium]|nr:AMP-binding protein [Clostridia bacterium]
MQTFKGIERFHGRIRLPDLKQHLRYAADKFGDMDAYIFRRVPKGEVYTRSYRRLLADVEAFGTQLLAMGLHGNHIVIVGANSYEWVVAHHAVVGGTGVSVPLDRQLPESEVINLTRRGEAAAFIFHPKHLDIAAAAARALPGVRHFICMDPERLEGAMPDDPRFCGMDSLIREGYARIASGDRSFLDAVIDPEAMCSLLFTSGTTANSKGVMLNHRNICANVYSSVRVLEILPGDRYLSILPLHHTFENTVGVYIMTYYGATICFTDGLRYLTDNLKEWKINIMLGVPLLFENIYRQIGKTLEKSGKAKLVKTMLKLTGVLRKTGIDIRRKVFHQIHEALGGGIKLCVSGAAALDEEVVRFFDGIGIDFFCGYGLTETSPVACCGNKFVNAFGSVGQPIPDVEIAIDTQETEPGAQAFGEILIKGPNIMLGYFQNPEDTAEALGADGWFRSGDIGYLDRKGCLHITGRKKSMIVLTNGKKAFPEEIEFLLDRIPGVSESIVWGDQSSREAVDICAKLVIRREDLPAGAGDTDEALADWAAAEIREINKRMPAYKSVKYFLLTEEDLVKTTTLKIRRPQEMEKIHAWLDEKGLTMKTASRMSVR